MFKHLKALAFVVALFFPVALGAPTIAAECLGVKVPDSANVGNTNLVLNGLGPREATFLKVKVYVAGLYLPEKSSDAGHILGADKPWKLALHFVRDVDASDIRDAFESDFKNAAGDKLAALKQRIETLNAAMIDFKEGHSLAFTNDPAKGVSVDVNGAGGPEITGADFSSTLLSIWIGSAPPNKELRTGLLGGKCD